MPDPSPQHRPRSPRPAAAAALLLLAGAGAVVLAVALGLWVTDHVSSTRLWRVEAVVGPAVVAVGVLAAAWVGVSALVAGTCAAVRSTGRAWRAGEAAVHRWAPGAVRRALAVAVAAGVGLGSAVGAHATVEAPPAPAVVTVDLGWTPTTTTTSVADPATTTPPTTGSPTALPTESADPPTGRVDLALPVGTTVPPVAAPPAADADATVSGGPADAAEPIPVVPVAAPLPAPDDTAPHAVPPAPAGTIEVRAGDTLWGLAARTLGPDATDAAIAAEWPRWYAANAATIGPDPDILTPGQVLVVPTSDGGLR